MRKPRSFSGYCTICQKISRKRGEDNCGDTVQDDAPFAAAPSVKAISGSIWLGSGAKGVCIEETPAILRGRVSATKLDRSNIGSRRAGCVSSIERAHQAATGATWTNWCRSCGRQRVLAVNVAGFDACRAAVVAGSSTAVRTFDAGTATGSPMNPNPRPHISARPTRPASSDSALPVGGVILAMTSSRRSQRECIGPHIGGWKRAITRWRTRRPWP